MYATMASLTRLQRAASTSGLEKFGITVDSNTLDTGHINPRVRPLIRDDALNRSRSISRYDNARALVCSTNETNRPTIEGPVSRPIVLDIRLRVAWIHQIERHA